MLPGLRLGPARFVEGWFPHRNHGGRHRYIARTEGAMSTHEPSDGRVGTPDPELVRAWEELTLDELRAYRRRLAHEEERVSYWRRLLHARIDVLEAQAHQERALTIEELVRMVEWGMTPLQAMRSATSNAAALLRLTDVGVVVEGAAADLVLYDANPLEQIDVVRKPSAVWRAGELVAGT